MPLLSARPQAARNFQYEYEGPWLKLPYNTGVLSTCHLGSKLPSLIEAAGLLVLDETTLDTNRGSSLIIGLRDKSPKFVLKKTLLDYGCVSSSY